MQGGGACSHCGTTGPSVPSLVLPVTPLRWILGGGCRNRRPLLWPRVAGGQKWRGEGWGWSV